MEIMARKRKYTRSGEEPKAFECTNRKCKWQGTDADKALTKRSGEVGTVLTCPDCHNDEFYGLLEWNEKEEE